MRKPCRFTQTSRRVARAVPPISENGDALTLSEFLRHYEHMHDCKKAELINVVTRMLSPLGIEHAEADGLMHGWPGTFAIENNLKFYPNPTLLLDRENSFQPDAILCTAPCNGGRTWLNPKGYLCGAPELIVEVAATVSIDLRDKRRIYRRSGVTEYIVWRTQDKAVDWFVLKDGEYVPLSPERGLYRSVIFPKLVLDTKALLARDGARVIAALKRK